MLRTKCLADNITMLTDTMPYCIVCDYMLSSGEFPSVCIIPSVNEPVYRPVLRAGYLAYFIYAAASCVI